MSDQLHNIADNAGEIKFRAFDSKLKSFVYFGLWNAFVCAEDMRGSVRQYLGVKDSAGNEVYFGDRVISKAKAFTADWQFRADVESGKFGCATFFASKNYENLTS